MAPRSAPPHAADSTGTFQRPSIAARPIRPHAPARELSPLRHGQVLRDPHAHRSPAHRDLHNNNNNYNILGASATSQHHTNYDHPVFFNYSSSTSSLACMSMDLDSPFRPPHATIASGGGLSRSQPPSPLGQRASLFYPTCAFFDGQPGMQQQQQHPAKIPAQPEDDDDTAMAVPRTPEIQRIRNPRSCSVAKRTPGLVIDMESLEPVDYMNLSTPVNPMHSASGSATGAGNINGVGGSVCRPSPFYKPELYHPSPERYMIIEDSDCTMSPPSCSPVPIGLQTPRRPPASNSTISGTPMSWRGPSARKLFGGVRETCRAAAAASPLAKTSPAQIVLSPCTGNIQHTRSPLAGLQEPYSSPFEEPLKQHTLTEALGPNTDEHQAAVAQRLRASDGQYDDDDDRRFLLEEFAFSQSDRLPSPIPSHVGGLQHPRESSQLFRPPNQHQQQPGPPGDFDPKARVGTNASGAGAGDDVGSYDGFQQRGGLSHGQLNGTHVQQAARGRSSPVAVTPHRSQSPPLCSVVGIQGRTGGSGREPTTGIAATTNLPSSSSFEEPPPRDSVERQLAPALTPTTASTTATVPLLLTSSSSSSSSLKSSMSSSSRTTNVATATAKFTTKAATGTETSVESTTPQHDAVVAAASVHRMQTRSAKKQNQKVKKHPQQQPQKQQKQQPQRAFSDVCGIRSVSFAEDEQGGNQERSRRLLFGPITMVSEETCGRGSSGISGRGSLPFGPNDGGAAAAGHYELRRTPQRVSRGHQERYTTC